MNRVSGRYTDTLASALYPERAETGTEPADSVDGDGE